MNDMTTNLATYSVVLTYSAMAVYVIAFISFALDMAKRAGQVTAAAGAGAAAPEERTVATVQGGTVVLEKVDTTSGRSGGGGTKFERVGMAMTILALVLHVAATVLRGIAADRVPWGNMFEFSLTGTALITLIFLLVQLWQNLKFLGVFITGLTIILLGIATVNYWVPVVPLQPALQSYWLVIHVFVAIAGTGFFALGAGLAVAQLVQTYRQGRPVSKQLRFMETLPDADRLEVLTYRSSWSASCCGPSRSSPAPSGPSVRGAATGAGTPRRSGPSSSGSSTPGTSTLARRAAGAAPARRGWRSSASPR